MKRPYKVKKQWRAVGACEFDVFHRDNLRDIGDDIVGKPEEIWAVIETKKDGQVIADCHCLKDAQLVRNALNFADGKFV